MPEPVFLIEGFMEKLAVQRICPKRIVRRIGCNGKDAPMSNVAEFIYKQIRVMGNCHYPIVILLDREQRKATCEALICELKAELAKKGIPSDQIIIGMPDRCIESWILADAAHLFGEEAAVKMAPYEDGKMGKPMVRRLLGAHIFYHETTVGLELFLKARPSEIYKKSQSFKLFVDSLNIKCRWKDGCFVE